MSIGYNLRKLRTRQSKSQQEIADLLDIDRKTYVNWENDQNDVKSEYIPKLATIFDVEIKDLFHDLDSKIEIIQQHNEGKDSSLLNGAILIITDKNSVEDLIKVIKNKLEKEK
ncbi:transcriptional regulator with XRE-family HTH domain [Chryseobacterium defluvii]|uniref:Transcriptional regulator with XRE-family HTH domain n=1 Tax=Chryseobacterium defluvii TaxID=160396 RepID=A0A840KDG3_9FLAO|nr:helix-turn-helix transcriptional regulator [Chryseobacterium defluvii]MBB4805012.1 transcriptional regulator with XRE-family HTH domain [Chryseobacterium defluvii]